MVADSQNDTKNTSIHKMILKIHQMKTNEDKTNLQLMTGWLLNGY